MIVVSSEELQTIELAYLPQEWRLSVPDTDIPFVVNDNGTLDVS